MDEHGMRALHWLPEQDLWAEIDWNDFLAFRAFYVPFKRLPGVAAGVHYFVVCVCADEQTYNIIPHKYLVDPDGKISRDNFYGWNPEERDDYNRLMLVMKFGPGEAERLDRIRQKGAGAMDLPPNRSLP
jgi:hypothetical protein